MLRIIIGLSICTSCTVSCKIICLNILSNVGTAMLFPVCFIAPFCIYLNVSGLLLIFRLYILAGASTPVLSDVYNAHFHKSPVLVLFSCKYKLTILFRFYSIFGYIRHSLRHTQLWNVGAYKHSWQWWAD